MVINGTMDNMEQSLIRLWTPMDDMGWSLMGLWTPMDNVGWSLMRLWTTLGNIGGVINGPMDTHDAKFLPDSTYDIPIV